MSIKGTCTICTDFFDKEKDISVTNCGHIFHAYCLGQWLKLKKTCPQCRAPTSNKQIVQKIFINYSEQCEKSLDVFDIKNKLDESECCISKLKLENKILNDNIKTIEVSKDKFQSKAKAIKKELDTERNTIQILRADMEVMQKEVADARKLKDEVLRLRKRLNLVEKIEVVLHGQKADVDEMLEKYTGSSGKASTECKQLGVFCVALKQEFETIKQSRNQIAVSLSKSKKDLHRKEELLLSKVSQIENLELSICNFQKNEDALTTENASLKKKLSALHTAINSPSDTKSSAVSRLIAESPAPEFLTPLQSNTVGAKRSSQLGQPIRMKKPRLSSSFDEKYDSDDTTTHSKPYAFGENTGSTISSPASIKMRNHCQELGLNFVNTTSKHSKLSNNKENYKNITALQRSKLIQSKAPKALSCVYDGLGGHQRSSLLQPNRPSLKTATAKFSSLNTNFDATTTLTKNKLNRLKRIARK